MRNFVRITEQEIMRRLFAMTRALAAAAMCAAVSISCHKDNFIDPGSRKVFLLYAAAHNDLRDDIYANLQDLKKGYLPAAGDEDDILLVFQRIARNSSTATMTSDMQTAPVLLRYYKGSAGMPAADTLKVFPKNTNAADPATLKEVLEFVRDAFPAGSYGMMFSSHATGWLPKGYYANSSSYERGAGVSSVPSGLPDGAVPYVAPKLRPGEPRTKSIGQDIVDGNAYELTVKEFAGAIPFRLDYIIFDACLMGCIEVAYGLKDVADEVAFSPAEVLAAGFDYTKVASRLLERDEPDLKGLCSDYFEYYDTREGIERAATITLVDLRKIGPLAEACRTLFDKYADNIAALNPARVQRYYRYDYRWFYDLEDILLQAGIDGAEQAELRAALDGCIVYKAATPSFLSSYGSFNYGGFEIRHYSGLSMYLPIQSSRYLNTFYRGDITWNAATGLLK